MKALDFSKSAKLRRLNAFGKKLARTSQLVAVKNAEQDVANFALKVLDKQFADASKAMKAAEAAPPTPPPTPYSQPSGPFNFSPSKGVYYK